jgi:hypothetical protein
MPAGRGGAARSVMFGKIKRLDRGLVISALGHFGLLAIGLIYLYLGASAHEAVPPDATLVELVTPQEMPRFSGAPTDLRTSGIDAPSPKSQPAVRPQEAKPKPEQKQQKQQRDAQKSAPPKPKALPLPQIEVGEAVNAPLEQPPPDPPPPAEAQTPDTPETAAQRAQLALLGGGFNAPPVDSPIVGYDFTEPFRRVVSACAPPVPSVDPRENISIRVRVFLNRDGTLTKAPLSRDANPSEKQQAMLQSFAAGLEKCQPFTMLPQDKYAQWKTLDLVVFPMQPYGG